MGKQLIDEQTITIQTIQNYFCFDFGTEFFLSAVEFLFGPCLSFGSNIDEIEKKKQRNFD